MQTKIKTRIRVGRISFINCLPFFYEPAKRPESETLEIRYVENYPTRLNLALRQGHIDISPISSLEYLNHQSRYYLLPELALGCRDFSGSVLLLSQERIEHLSGEVVALTRQSLSSAALIRILLRFKYKFQNRFKPVSLRPDDALAQYKAALLIGDEALFHQSKKFVYKYDLSELWWNWTEKPFCFALWAVRREFADSQPEALKLFVAMMKKNRDQNLADIETFVKNALDIGFLDPRFSKIYGYFFNLYYQLDRSMTEGLELFYRLANRLGISPRLRRLDFFDGS